jgi:hypothetical protein
MSERVDLGRIEEVAAELGMPPAYEGAVAVVGLGAFAEETRGGGTQNVDGDENSETSGGGSTMAAPYYN